MSVWTKTEPSPTPTGPWFKAFAKKLKAWWEGLFAGTGNRADSEIHGEPAGTPPSLIASADESQKAAARADSLQEYDPLADWTALVAEGAPELLLPPEEGGIPWQRVSATSAEIGADLEDTTDPSTLFAERAPIKPPTQQWWQRHKARPAIRNTASESRPPLPIAGPDSEISSVSQAAKVSPRFPHLERLFLPNDATLGQPSTQDGSAEVGRPRFGHEGSKTRPVEDEMNLVRRSAGEPFRGDQTLRPVPPDATRNAATESSASQPRSNIAAPAGSSKRVADRTRGSSRVLPIFPAFPAAGKIHHQESAIVAGENAKRAPILPMRPKPDNEGALRPISAPVSREERLPAFRARSVASSEESGPVQSKWSEDLDLWPELPGDQPASESNWLESYRSQEHLQALDLEQRGGD